MATSYPTRQEIAQLITGYWIAGGPLTTLGPFSALQSMANAFAAVLESYYQRQNIELPKDTQQGVYSAFDFSPLSPTAASVQLSLTGVAATPVPANTIVSTVGNATSPAQLFQTTAAATLLAANPTATATLAQSSGSSSFTASELVYITYAWTSTNTSGSTLAAPVASITISTVGNVITTPLTLPSGADGVNIFCGTSASPLELGSISSAGAVTYSGSAISGLAATVSGSTLSITVSAAASATGAALPTFSASGQAQVTATAVTPGVASVVAAGTITNVVSPVAGLITATNPSPSSGGADAESLSAQQRRFTIYRNSLSRATLAALETGALTVSGVQKVRAVDRAYFTVMPDQSSGGFTDDTIEANLPKGVPFTIFPNALTIGDALYIGADRSFASIYLDVSTAGSGLSATWQYYNSAGNWVSLSPTTDQTTNGQTSGTVAWTVPSDWVETTVNNIANFWIRLSVTSATVTTVPQWYQILSLDPPPGFVNLYYYLQSGASASTTLTSLQSMMNNYRAAGITVSSIATTVQSVNVTANITPTSFGSLQPLQSAAQTAITNLIAGFSIGQSLALSQIYFAITSLYAGQAVQEVQITAPTADVLIGVDTLLTPGVITMNLV